MPNGVGNPPLATVVHQRAFDPYGEVIWAEDFAGSVPLKLGHKGLFVDRLDVGVVDIATGDETPRIVPFAHMLLHNRNRVYAPGLGRFMQRDPNDTAMTLLAAATFHGSPAYGAADGFDLMGMYGDGPNLYQYLGGNPMIRSDPLGLYVDILIPGPSDFISGALESMVAEYSARLEYDVEWALDWSMGDDWHSRLDNTWVSMALGQGLYNAFEIGFGDYSVNPLDIFASAGRRGGSPGAPNPRLWILGARTMGPLDRLSPFDIAKAFKETGYKVSQHFVDRLRGVGPKSDPGRMRGMGIRSIEDVQQILRYGTRVKQPNGRTANRYLRSVIIIDTDGRTMITNEPHR